MVFQSFRKFVYERRRGIATFAGFAGGLYLAGKYALRRLEDVRERFVHDKAAKENLRKRFLQNQEDCVFTAQALVSTLGTNILEALDVEALTQELQQQNSKVIEDPAASLILVTEDRPSPALDSSAIREASMSYITPSGQSEQSPPEHSNESSSGSQIDPMSESSASWIEQFSASQIASEEKRDASYGTSDSFISADISDVRPPADMSESVISTFSMPDSMTESVNSSSHASEVPAASEETTASPPAPRKTKLQLWKEIRTTTFTRTITLIYCITLLSLQTHVQLNILASHRYVQSIIELEEEEKRQDRSSDSTFTNALFGASSSTVSAAINTGLSLGGGLLDWGETDDDDYAGDEYSRSRRKVLRVSDLTERKYLTLSWWLLNVGWKGVMNKVEKAVHQVFDSVPLKAMLAPEDIRGYIDLVRLEVDKQTETDGWDDPEAEDLTETEMERLQGRPTSEPTQTSELPRANFLSAILPLAPASVQLSLTEGGLPLEAIYPSHLSGEAQVEQESFETLIEETKEFITSKDFELVLEKALDAAFDLLENWIRSEVYEEPEIQDGDGDARIVEVNKMKLAAILPGVARWGHQAVNSIPTELVGVITGLREVSAFSAIIFSSFEESMHS